MSYVDRTKARELIQALQLHSSQLARGDRDTLQLGVIAGSLADAAEMIQDLLDEMSLPVDD